MLAVFFLLLLAVVVVVSFSSPPTTQPNDRAHTTRAMEYYQEALMTFDENCLAFFRAAVRLDGTNQIYIDALAVAEKRFMKREQEVILLDNVHESVESKKKPALPIIEPRLFDSSSDTALFDLPFILRREVLSQLKNWNIFPFSTPTSLLSSVVGLADFVVDFYPHSMKRKPSKVFKVTAKEAIDYLAFPDGAYLSVDASQSGIVCSVCSV